MKIAINARFAGLDKIEGYGRFTSGLVKSMCSLYEDAEFTLMYDRPPLNSVMHHRNITESVKGPAARHPVLWKFWYDFSMPAMARNAGADLIFSPDGFCSLNTGIPQVLAIHDLAFLHFPRGINKLYKWYYSNYTPKFIQKAKHIVTVSEFSKQDILSHYPMAKGKISVIANAAAEGFKPQDWRSKERVKEKYANGSEYFLYVGAIHPRKNLVNLLKGFSWFKKWQKSNMKLVLAGRMAWGTEEFSEQLKTYKYRDEIVLTGYLPDEELQQVVGAAYGMVYPSYWEGFGLPVLESMQSGIPVITSSNTAMSELCEDAAMYCDAADSESWGRAMAHLYKNENHRSELIEKGLEKASRYNWNNSAGKLMEIFENVKNKSS